MPKLEVGDVVWWHWPTRPQLVPTWQRSFGQDPLVVTEVVEDGVKLKQVSDGKPVTHHRNSPIHRQVFRKDEFLTAVYRASGNINPKSKPKKKGKTE